MKLPTLNESEKKIINTTVFGGYNHNESIKDGEMYDMKNLSSESYPLLDQRRKRAEMTLASGSSGTIYSVDGRAELVYIRGTHVYYDNTQVSGLTLSTAETMLPKKVTSLGSYMCIWPDKKYFNTVNTSDYGSMEAIVTGTGGVLERTNEYGNLGELYPGGKVAAVTPPCPEGRPLTETEMEIYKRCLWVDKSSTYHKTKYYDASLMKWSELPLEYVKIYGFGALSASFSEGDTITISGMEADNNDPNYAIDTGIAETVEALNGTHTILKVIPPAIIIIKGTISHDSHWVTGDISIARRVPDFDYVCESQNRIWGCKYGLVDGVMMNEIKCSKLGDFKNWDTYLGLSTDSFTASIGTDGPFTGAVAQRGYPVFFKENTIHRITGTAPSSYAITTIAARGIQEGCWRSAVVANELIYYKSRDGVMAFDGSMPYSISSALGNIKYSDARAGQVDGKYYISMKDERNEWNLFVYDANTKIWHKEDDLKVLDFGTLRDELYAIDEQNNKLLLMTGKNPEAYAATAETNFDWYAVFGLFGTDIVNQKYLSRFNIRMQIEDGATVKLYIQYNHDGVWTNAGTITGRGTKTFMLPVVPRRCDHLQVKIAGTGRCRIYSISRIMEVGQDG